VAEQQQNPVKIAGQSRGFHLYGTECFIVEFDQIVAQVVGYMLGDVVSFAVSRTTLQVGYFLNDQLVYLSPVLFTPQEGETSAAHTMSKSAEPVVQATAETVTDDAADFFDNFHTIGDS
jgi:hypothetical protein